MIVRRAIRIGVASAALAMLPAGFVACSGCNSSNNASQDAATFDAAPPCTETWCDGLRGFCDEYLTLCYREIYVGSSQAADLLKGCVDGVGYLARTKADANPTTLVSDVTTCMKTAKTCADAIVCHSIVAPPRSLEGDEDAAVSEGGATDGASPFPPGVVPQPGDDPACVRCAVTRCTDESKLCFVDPAGAGCSAGGVHDCCANYRQCIASCVSTHPDAGPEFTACVRDVCDAHEPTGKTQYDGYAACMSANCGGCGSDAGP